MTKALIVYGAGIGCQAEVELAFQQAGAETQQVHINSLSSGAVKISDYQIINFCGGFLYGDILGSGMCAANQIDLAKTNSGQSLKEELINFAAKGNVIYGQCNGFQLLVKLGLLPGNKGDYSQKVTLCHNDCGSYRVDYVAHLLEKEHFAFAGLKGQLFHLWCRHGEGKIEFAGEFASAKDQQSYFDLIDQENVLLRYANADKAAVAESFPHNPNGSIRAIAGLVDSSGYIFGHMAHPEVSIFSSRSPNWFSYKDKLRRGKRPLEEYESIDIGSLVFRNIVSIFK